MAMLDDPYRKLRPPGATPDDEICNCAADTAIVLQSHLSANPLACARCNLEVPPERIDLDRDLVEAIAWWRQFHDCFYFLWLDSREFEAWAAAQLSDPSSPANVRGLEIVRRLNSKRHCYLWWFQDEGADGWVPATHCPRCSRPLEVRFSGERPQGGALRVCEHCLVALAV
jgi:hypothetical protein